MRPAIACLLGVIVALAAPGAARAGRSRFAWLYGTELAPERGVELETWIIQQNAKGDARTRETDIWWGIVAALSSHLEIAIPIELEYHDDRDGAPPQTQLVRFGGELRWRPQSPDPIDAGPLTGLFRFAVKRLVQEPDGVQLEIDAVASYQAGDVLAVIDAGAIEEHGGGLDIFQVRPGAGVSYRLGGSARLGLELYGEIAVNHRDAEASWMVAGPSFSVTSGRLWLAAAIGLGVADFAKIRDAGRITLGVAF